MSNRVVALWVPEADIKAGYFVLSDLAKLLPEDAAIIDSRASYSSAHYVHRIASSKFPEVNHGEVAPRADFMYNSTDGAKIQWPSSEYEKLYLDKLNTTIAESINKDAEVMEAEGGSSVSAIEQMQREFAKMITGMPAYKDVAKGCNHEWFAYGRTAATKHCKKCGLVKENVVDKE